MQFLRFWYVQVLNVKTPLKNKVETLITAISHSRRYILAAEANNNINVIQSETRNEKL